MPIFELKPLNFEDFKTMEDIWSGCLDNSQNNSLFSSWIWQISWWEIWQPRLNLELLLIGVYQDGFIVGIIPCYTYQKTSNKLIISKTIKCCELIGSYSANHDSIRSEYLNFILPSHCIEQVLPLVFELFIQEKIDEVILQDVAATNNSSLWLKNTFPRARIAANLGVKINVNRSFESYLTTLGKNTRLKLFNRRELLQDIKLKEVVNNQDIDLLFSELNKMHIERWGKVCFSQHTMSFHKQIARFFLEKNQLKSTICYENDKVIAVCYDILSKDTQYNIQLGFKEYVNNKVSTGTIMLGYAIEAAHNNSLITGYDLLIGEGKNSNYKVHYKGEPQPFITIKIPLTLFSKIVYSIEKIVAKIRKSLW